MDHKDLEVWKSSMDLIELIYKITSVFPDAERYVLTSKMQRAEVSIPSKISD
ncbi:four helix bundle protein [Tamlana fucoidanivorans]|uniref:four helix bundle protein n=1 Tax=Allotamlana fucoidanivorans TaxID=2583814 RepID=UPI001E4B4BAD|nr:four helix bundle protein [Tamlana fucoidanivorans]